MMDEFFTAHASGENWAYAARDCVEAIAPLPALDEGMEWLGFIYVTDDFGNDLGSILTYLRQKTGVGHWNGTIGIGVLAVCGSQNTHKSQKKPWECYDEPGLVIMLGQFPEGSFHVLPTIDDTHTSFSTKTKDWIEQAQPGFGLIYADPNLKDPVATIEGVAEAMGGPLGSSFLVGGLTSSRYENYQIADHITGGGVSGVAFAGSSNIATGLSQGCLPLGEAHLVTDAVENVVLALDGKPALDVMREDIGELLAQDIRRISGYIHVALPVEGSDTGDYLVRNLMAVDEERGWIGIAGDLVPGDRLIFVRRDPASARADLDQMLEKLKNRLPSKPKGGIYVSCVARGPNMFGAVGEEAKILREALGDVPIIGFFGAGEVSNSRLYAYTGILTLFY